jgi:predicted DsbA family dithiol-disulfide isomerase
MVEIQIWGDFECPFCYLQTIVLLKLKKQYAEKLVIHWKSFELNTRLNFTQPTEEYLKNLEIAATELIAIEEHLNFMKPKVLPNIRLAQESVYYASSENKSLEMANAIFNAFFNHELDISDQNQILTIAKNVGIDSIGLNEALDDAIYTRQVILDEREFQTMGFSAVPAMMIGERNFSPRSFLPLVGFKTYEELNRIISQIKI